ncbi:glycoside hydrolase [Lentinula raphanica]|uniref:Glycoside hydrolase n=1 Tax=Lentinula raphanica TaxID=153919 RepID=A0AA38UFZ4_9AGAR|nr:glycoside hydrolase [Lentinula raphanica]KAJ3972699.1 glycoside hydrolase [Lentinula raphanica]
MANKLTDDIKKDIGQHFIFGFHGPSPFSGEGTNILTLTGLGYWVGNVIYMKRNVVEPESNTTTGTGSERGRAEVLASHIAGLQQHARDSGQPIGLGIGTDQEGGLVSAFSTNGVATLFPGAMAMASISEDPSASEDAALPNNSLDFTEAIYAAQGAELDMLGVNWAFAPVGDVNSERENPVIGVRSFGDDPERVAHHVLSSCKGLTSAGVAPSVKHFPGHGDTRIDSHLGLPRIYKEWAHKVDGSGLEDIELVPFRRLAEKSRTPSDTLLKDKASEMITVMTGHMSLPLVTGKVDEPASLSPAVTAGILRESTKGLDFDGVVVTDCLEMDAISRTKADLMKEKEGEVIDKGIGANHGPPSADRDDKEQEWQGGPGIEEGAVLALEAGADVVMICHTFEKQKAALERVWAAVESGRISLDKLRASTERVMKWKKAVGLEWNVYDQRAAWQQVQWDKLKEKNASLSLAAYKRAIVCLKEGKMLDPQKKVVVFTPATERYNLAVDDAEGVLRTKGGAVRNTAGASFLSFVEAIRQTVPDTRHIVFGQQDTEASYVVKPGEQIIYTLRNADRGVWQLRGLEQILKSAQAEDTVVVVSSSTPYDLTRFRNGLRANDSHLACSEYTTPALAAVKKVVFGEERATGRVPVMVSVM